MSIARWKENVFRIFNMDATIADTLASIMAKVPLHTLLTVILEHHNFTTSPARAAIIDNADTLVHLLLNRPETQYSARQIAFQTCTEILMGEITRMGARDSGWHFSAQNASAQKIESFSIAQMARVLKEQAPHLWQMLSSMLVSDPTRESRRSQYLQRKTPKEPSQMVVDAESQTWDEEDEYWACDASGDLESSIAELEGNDDDDGRPSKRVRRAGTRNSTLVQVKVVTITSVLLMSSNQKCNALPSMIGLFCHSTNAPELVIETLAHAGLSISTTSIHNMVNSLSTKSADNIRALARTLTASFAYDNFDMEFKSHTATIEKHADSLKHATSAIIFPLIKTTTQDLRCSDELWRTDPTNPYIPNHEKRPPRGLESILPISTEPSLAPSTHIRIQAWHFRHALVTFCEPFKIYQSKLEGPETINQIPITKTEYVPCRAMDINQSTADGQCDIMQKLHEQGGIGSASDNPGVCDISSYVQLVHGDLRTGELLEASKRSRSIETNPVRRLQYVIFVMGLFHYLMACGDAIWRIFLESKPARKGPNSLYAQTCAIRPHDYGRITQKYNFRWTHELIHQCGWARMLDCWHVEVIKRNSTCKSLDDYARTTPPWEDLVEISIYLALNYLDKPDADDLEFRNNSITLARLLQYIELAHAMKYGDIGRVEATFLHWALVFKSAHKHKYATYLIKLMVDMKHVYPESLKRAIRMNWLVNPTGTEDGFRGVDWVVELMNLYTKVTYSGKSSNRSFQLVVKNSPLIETFRRVHTNIRENFHLLHRSVRHAPVNLQSTLGALTQMLQKHRAHESATRVGVEYMETEELEDHFRQGMFELMKVKNVQFGVDGGNEGEIEDSTLTSVELELEDIIDM